MSTAATTWPTASRSRPCPHCGSRNRCLIAPDGGACKCWRDGGKIHRFNGNGNGNGNGTGYVGAAHRKPRKSFRALEQAIAETEQIIKRDHPEAERVGQWEYPQNFVTVRWNVTAGRKIIRPFHQNADGWMCGDPAGKLPLYLRDRIDAGHVYIVEGEKCADAARTIGLNAITSSHGSSAADKSDWTPIKGRDVVIFPDNDEPGRNYAAAVGEIAAGLGCRVKIASLPGLAEGEDIADFIEQRDSRDSEDIAAEIAGVVDAEPFTETPRRRAATELVQIRPTLRPPLIHGIARQTETVNIIAPTKRGKSWLVDDLAMSVATGRTWLNHYPVERRCVLIVDNELHEETKAERIRTIAAARGILALEIDGWLDIDCIRGRVTDLHSMRPYFDAIKPGEYGLIVLDAWYRFLPDGVAENDNAAFTSMYNTIDRHAARIGCAFVLIHHTSKGTQSEKAITDVGAGAGSQSRAADTHLILRNHEADDAVVLDAAVRSWPPIQPTCLRWQYPLWNVALDLDPSKLRRPSSRAPGTPEPEPWTVDRFVTEFVTHHPVTISSILEATEATDLTASRAKQLLAAAEDAGKVVRHVISSRSPVKFSLPEFQL